MKRIKQMILLLMLLALVGCGAKTWQEHYELGMKYLMENKYEKAILSFTAAIEIDPMQEDAYIYMAEAYQALGEYEAAIETLQQGYELTESEKITQRIKVMEMNQRLEQDSAFSDTIQSLYTAMKNKDHINVGRYFDKVGFNPEDFNVDRLLYDGTHFCTESDQPVLAFRKFYRLFYGDFENGLPHGNEIYVAAYEWCELGGVFYNWYEGEWNHGSPIGNPQKWEEASEAFRGDTKVNSADFDGSRFIDLNW